MQWNIVFSWQDNIAIVTPVTILSRLSGGGCGLDYMYMPRDFNITQRTLEYSTDLRGRKDLSR